VGGRCAVERGRRSGCQWERGALCFYKRGWGRGGVPMGCVRLWSWMLACGVAAAFTGGCGGSGGLRPSPETPLPAIGPAARQVALAGNEFGLELFGELASAAADRNVVVCPISVSMALGMTYNGAEGTTERAMRDVLGYGDLTRDEIDESYRDIIEYLARVDPSVELRIANSIWCRKGVRIKREFLEVNRDYFDADVRTLDFAWPGAAREINRWVEEKTCGRIEEIVDDPIDPMMIMFLIDAVYFRGAWTRPFDPEDTRDDVFHRPDGSTVPCRMMSVEDTLLYGKEEGLQIVELPYGRGGFSMVVMLPDRGADVDDLVGALTPRELEKWTEGLEEVVLYLEMPKFKLRYGAELKGPLCDMGMGVAFDPELANFARLYEGPENAYVSEVKHKTFIQVDEVGTEAAGVTEVGIRLTAIPMMRIDRTFVFAIRERETNAILFVGKIVEPVWI